MACGSIPKRNVPYAARRACGPIVVINTGPFFGSSVCIDVTVPLPDSLLLPPSPNSFGGAGGTLKKPWEEPLPVWAASWSVRPHHPKTILVQIVSLLFFKATYTQNTETRSGKGPREP